MNLCKSAWSVSLAVNTADTSAMKAYTSKFQPSTMNHRAFRERMKRQHCQRGIVIFEVVRGSFTGYGVPHSIGRGPIKITTFAVSQARTDNIMFKTSLFKLFIVFAHLFWSFRTQFLPLGFSSYSMFQFYPLNLRSMWSSFLSVAYESTWTLVETFQKRIMCNNEI